MEKKGILGNSTGQRPGDVTFQKWSDGKGLAIDVAVTNSPPRMFVGWLRVNGMLLPRSMENMTQDSRVPTMTSALWRSKLWAVNVEGEEVLRMLFRFAAKR